MIIKMIKISKNIICIQYINKILFLLSSETTYSFVTFILLNLVTKFYLKKKILVNLIIIINLKEVGKDEKSNKQKTLQEFIFFLFLDIKKNIFP